jgi:LytS/YehU family sensor histidine kinase
LLLALLGSEATKQIMQTQFHDIARFEVAVFFFLPCLMAWFCLTLKDSLIRWLSIMLGILLAVIKLVALSGILAGEGRPLASIVKESSDAVLFTEIWALVATGLIVWYAWKWPKQEA